MNKKKEEAWKRENMDWRTETDVRNEKYKVLLSVINKYDYHCTGLCDIYNMMDPRFLGNNQVEQAHIAGQRKYHTQCFVWPMAHL